MTTLASLFVFEILYILIYIFPLMVVIYLLDALGIESGWFSKDVVLLGNLIKLVLVFFLIFISGYRAKLAGDVYAEGNTTFWEAHTISGALLKAQLAMVPVIGRFFNKDE